VESINIHELAYQDHGPIPAPFRAIFGPSQYHEPRWAGIKNIRNIKKAHNFQFRRNQAKSSTTAI